MSVGYYATSHRALCITNGNNWRQPDQGLTSVSGPILAIGRMAIWRHFRSFDIVDMLPWAGAKAMWLRTAMRWISALYEKALGAFFTLGGGVYALAALWHLVGPVWGSRHTGTLLWMPLQQYFPKVWHFHSDLANSLIFFLLETPAWPWEALVGALCLRWGMVLLFPNTKERETA